MASITISSPSFLGGLTSTERSTTTQSRRRTLVVAKAASSSEGVAVKIEDKKENKNGRRDLMFAAAAAAACSIAGIALADEPARGTPEAKKAYAPICVTMPTARICHK
ncbi:hypothetical protein ACHQM5_018995 [Ranunculus cassubicifolius]